MFGVGPLEFVMVVLMSVAGLLPAAASAVFLWMCFKGRFHAPKTCPKCGADLRG